MKKFITFFAMIAITQTLYTSGNSTPFDLVRREVLTSTPTASKHTNQDDKIEKMLEQTKLENAHIKQLDQIKLIVHTLTNETRLMKEHLDAIEEHLDAIEKAGDETKNITKESAQKLITINQKLNTAIELSNTIIEQNAAVCCNVS